MNTRFNPTICGGGLHSGELHLGHLVMALINEYQAHEVNNGKFIVRFDDTQEWWRMRTTPEEDCRLKKDILEDLEWAGVKVDKWESQYEMREQVAYYKNEFGPLPVRDLRNNFLRAPRFLFTNANSFPYAPELTQEAVILDYLDAVSHLIRGAELAFQGGVYALICDLWRLPQPYQIYVDRMTVTKKNGEVEEVSKTMGNYKVRDFRERGYSDSDVRDLLAVACLKNPDGCWSLENLKMHPTIMLKNYPMLES